MECHSNSSRSSGSGSSGDGGVSGSSSSSSNGSNSGVVDSVHSLLLSTSGAAALSVLYPVSQQQRHQQNRESSSLYSSQDMVGSWVNETARCQCHSAAAAAATGMTIQSVDTAGRECCGKCSTGCSTNSEPCNCSLHSIDSHALVVPTPPPIMNIGANTGNGCMCTNMDALMKRCGSCGHDTARHSTVGCAELGCNCLICPSLVVKKTIGEWTFSIKKLQIEQWSAVSTGPQHEYSGMRIVFDMVDHHSTDISWELDFNPTYETRRFTIGAADVRALTWKEMDESTSALVIQLHRHPRFSVISRRITHQHQSQQPQQQSEDHTQCSHVENELGQWSFSSDFTPNQIASKFSIHVVYFDRHMQVNLINRLKMALKVRFDSVVDHHLLENNPCSPYFAYVSKDQHKLSTADIVLDSALSDAECDDCGHLVDDHGLIGCHECNACIVFVPRTSAADANGDSAFSLWKKMSPSPTALTSVLDRHFILPDLD